MSGRSGDADFIWGLATAAQQTESRNGRGRSNWDVWSDTPGKILDGSTTERLTEFDTRYPEDLDIMASAGVRHLRLSLSWPRIQPEGPGKPSEAGLDHYARLFDAMQARGIEPWVTLWHWDSPVWAGDFVDRDKAWRIADYAACVAARFNDRISNWMVMNEPNTVATRGYGAAFDPPGHGSIPKAARAIHHLNLAIGLMATATRANVNGRARVGTVHNCARAYPANANPFNRLTARFMDDVWNWAFLDPLFGRDYPVTLRPLLYGAVKSGDMKIIAAPLDFLGVNFYASLYFRMIPRKPFIELGGWPDSMEKCGLFPVDPEGFEDILTTVHDRYRTPIYVTETGFDVELAEAWQDRVRDPDRTRHYDSYFAALARARARGADVRGVFCWGATDNWEWSEGFTHRLGLIAVDAQTQKREGKDSLFKLDGQIARHFGPNGA
ncbi:MAG: family 1 glycosylhydrolase [Hyphomicrobiales bacterium]|nr:family 1 glycosylhydrolase [Hyphomicrobiales bacterium]